MLTDRWLRMSISSPYETLVPDDDGLEDARAQAAFAVRGSLKDGSGLSLSREAFTAYLEWRATRAKVLRQVPVSVLLYIAFAVGIVLRAQISQSYEFESRLVFGVVLGGKPGRGFDDYVSSTDGYFEWVDTVLSQTILPSTAPDGSLLPTEARGRLANSLGLIIGGIRLVQTRKVRSTCPLGSKALATLYGGDGVCHSDGASTISEPFGNATAAAALGVTDAFAASIIAGGNEGAEYQWFLNPEDGPAVMSQQVRSLKASGWLDSGTSTAAVQIGLLNGNAGLFGRVALGAHFTDGGAVDVSTSIASTPVDPYLGDAGAVTILFDVAFAVYWLYLFIGTSRRLVKASCERSGALGVGHSGGTSLRRLMRALCSYWRLLDVATTLTMLISISLWFDAVAKLASIRDAIDEAQPTGPSSFAGGPSPLSAQLSDAHQSFTSWKLSAVVMVRASGTNTSTMFRR